MEMEEKFRERLGHVKEEFNAELAAQSQEIKDEHKKELGEFVINVIYFTIKLLLLTLTIIFFNRWTIH